MSLDDLRKRVQLDREKKLERQRYLYKFAKDRGFSAGEARWLCVTSEENILKMVAERDNGAKNGKNSQ